MTRYKLFAFKIITVCIVPILTILVLELGLRVVGFGYSTKVFVEENGIVRNNWPFTLKYFPWSVARPMKSLQFPAKKEPDSLRIFVLGGSAAQGFPAEPLRSSILQSLPLILMSCYPWPKHA